MKRGLVVSVGGSKGAYAGGIIEYYLRNGISYDNLYGSSIGSLIIPFAAVGDYNQLKKTMLNIDMGDIFDSNPFKIDQQKDGVFRYSINYINVFKQLFIKNSSTLGSTEVLKNKTLPHFFPEQTYLDILKYDKALSIMVTNITTGIAEEKKLNECDYSEWIEWMWASTCAPPFMSIANINGHDYTDGGILSQVPIKQAILDGCDEIDIIVLGKKDNDYPVENIRNLFHYNIKLILLMMDKIKEYQIDLGYLMHHATKKVRLNFHYTPRRLTNNSLLFDSEVMSKWWEDGYKHTELNSTESYIIDGVEKTLKIIK